MASGQRKKRKIFGFDPNVFWLSVVSFFTDISSEMIMPILPLYFVNELRAGKALLGLMEGMAESLSSFLKFYFGHFSDRTRKRKRLVILGYAISNLIKPLFAFTTSSISVISIRMIDRVGKGIRTSPRDAMIIDASSAKDMGKNFGFHRTMDNFGELLGPAITALLLYLGYSYQNIFVLSAVPGIIAILLIIFFVREKKATRPLSADEPSAREKSTSETPPKLSWKILTAQNKAFKLLIVSVFFFGLANFSKVLLIPRAEEFGVPVALIPLIFLFSPIMSTLIALPAGMLSDKVGRKTILMVGYGVFAAMCLTFSFGDGLLLAGLGFLLHGIFFGLTDGAQRAYTADLAETGQRGTAMGIYHMTVGLSILPANAVAGLLWTLYGAEYMFAVSIGFALISSAILIKVRR